MYEVVGRLTLQQYIFREREREGGGEGMEGEKGKGRSVDPDREEA